MAVRDGNVRGRVRFVSRVALGAGGQQASVESGWRSPTEGPVDAMMQK